MIRIRTSGCSSLAKVQQTTLLHSWNGSICLHLGCRWLLQSAQHCLVSLKQVRKSHILLFGLRKCAQKDLVSYREVFHFSQRIIVRLEDFLLGVLLLPSFSTLLLPTCFCKAVFTQAHNVAAVATVLCHFADGEFYASAAKCLLC